MEIGQKVLLKDIEVGYIYDLFNTSGDKDPSSPILAFGMHNGVILISLSKHYISHNQVLWQHLIKSNDEVTYIPHKFFKRVLTYSGNEDTWSVVCLAKFPSTE